MIISFLEDILPCHILELIKDYYLYTHQKNRKFIILFNKVLKTIPKIKAPYCITPRKCYSNELLLYYKPKFNYGYNEEGYKYEKSINYDPLIHINNYVRFLYVVRIFKKLVYIEEVTNCSVNDLDEYLKWTPNNKINKSVLFNFNDDY